MSDTPIVWVMTQYLKDETKKPTYCSVVAKLDYDILEAELAACSAVVDRQQEQLDRNAEQLAALHQDASSKWAFLEWRDRAEKAEAKIDALMFEYCPEEMTEEQIARWKKHQRPVQEG